MSQATIPLPTEHRDAIWSAVYDLLCSAAEQLADDCNEYWRGESDPNEIRLALGTVGARLELLLALGPVPPANGRR